MLFEHPGIPIKSPVPWNKKDAIALKFKKYMDLNGCNICNSKHPARYVDSDICSNCAVSDADKLWKLWNNGAGDAPKPFPVNVERALSMEVDYFYKRELCKNSAHFIKYHIRSGKCLTCREAYAASTPPQLAPDAIVSRADAKTKGFAHFRTGLPCARGHTGARYVSTGNCIECLRLLPAMDPIVANRVFTVQEQQIMFAGCGRVTTRLMCDADGKRWNRLQFNMLFESPAIYELTGDRKPVSWAWDAFEANFGYGRLR